MPPPFTITDDPAPFVTSGVVYPQQTRTVTPPPWPDAAPWSDAASTPKPPPPPGTPAPTAINFGVGPVDPPCILNCGIKCLFFCSPWSLDINLPGLNLNFPGPDLNFPDPHDPDPLPDPKVSPSPTASITTSITSCAETSVATNFLVSCTSSDGKSPVCTTTSTSYATGCKVEATAVTTFAACPSIDPNEDQGEDGTVDACPFNDPDGDQGRDAAETPLPTTTHRRETSTTTHRRETSTTTHRRETSTTTHRRETSTTPTPQPTAKPDSFGLFYIEAPECHNPDVGPNPFGCKRIGMQQLHSCFDPGHHLATRYNSTDPATDFSGELWWEDGVCGSPRPYYCYVSQFGDSSDWNWQCNDDKGQTRATCRNRTGDHQEHKCPIGRGGYVLQLVVSCEATGIHCPLVLPDESHQAGGQPEGQGNETKGPGELKTPEQDYETCLGKGRGFLCKFLPSATPNKSPFEAYSDLKDNGWVDHEVDTAVTPSDLRGVLAVLGVDSSNEENRKIHVRQENPFSIVAGGPQQV